MRKQYHFRPSEKGLLAWDVDRLVALSKDLPRHQVPLSEIKEIDEPYWFDNGKKPTCRMVLDHFRLVNEVDFQYPIILCSKGRIMDGMHRVAKAFLEGREFIETVRFDHDPTPDYIGKRPEELPY